MYQISKNIYFLKCCQLKASNLYYLQHEPFLGLILIVYHITHENTLENDKVNFSILFFALITIDYYNYSVYLSKQVELLNVLPN